AWRGDESFQHWLYGPVLDQPDHLIDAVASARVSQPDYDGAQRRGFAESFDLHDESSSLRAARAIVERLPVKGRRLR
ncbi:MAG: glycerophosphotransferase, partial [Caulobacter sp.]|nr:glycerophosphotransferase [Caulobacter sp.]